MGFTVEQGVPSAGGQVECVWCTMSTVRHSNKIRVCFLKLAEEMLKWGLEEVGGHIPTLILQLLMESLFCTRTVLSSRNTILKKKTKFSPHGTEIIV